MRPRCWNRDPFDTPMSPDVCRTWAGKDHRIMDPAHPKYGTDSGDYYPRAMGWDCSGCRLMPEGAA